MENLELENKIVKVKVEKLAVSGIKEIEITIKDLVSIKLTDDIDNSAPIVWILDCLSDDDKLEAITYLLKKANVI